jgi:hypothetical protein
VTSRDRDGRLIRSGPHQARALRIRIPSSNPDPQMSSSLLTKALTSLARAPLVAAPRAFSGVVSGASFKLPELPYDPSALEPFISGEIMRVRYRASSSAGARLLCGGAVAQIATLLIFTFSPSLTWPSLPPDPPRPAPQRVRDEPERRARKVRAGV